MWTTERHDRITYTVCNGKGSGGVVTKQKRDKWHAESDNTGKSAVCPTLTKASWWIMHQAEIAARKK